VPKLSERILAHIARRDKQLISLVKNYELIEHTADIGIRVRGANLKDLFINAASAMFDIIVDKQTSEITSTKKIKIKLKAENIEELFVDWLNDLLSLSAIKELIFSDFQIKKLDKNKLEAVAFGAGFKNYKLKTEIKAATYHELKLRQDESGWQAEVILDV
jgi:SHS2 domain-containing protein